MPVDLNEVKRKLRKLSARQNIIHKSELYRDVLINYSDNILKLSEYYNELLVDIRSVEYVIDNLNEEYRNITERNVMHINEIYKKHKIKIKFAQYYLDPETDKFIKKI